jgi:hypothetical protein
MPRNLAQLLKSLRGLDTLPVTTNFERTEHEAIHRHSFCFQLNFGGNSACAAAAGATLNLRCNPPKDHSGCHSEYYRRASGRDVDDHCLGIEV